MGKTGFVAVIVFLIDQVSKWYVVFHLDLINYSRLEVFPPFLNFEMAWNKGINFGLFANHSEAVRWGLTIFAVVISIAVLRYARNHLGWGAAFLFGCIVGGALGNALDRVIHGAVADFLNMSCCGFDNPYAFNLADVFVFIGAFGLIFFLEKLPKRA